LILKLNKRFAYGMTYLDKVFLLLCFFVPGSNFGQTDTVLLNGVEVNAKKTDLSAIGKKRETIDSTLKEQFKFNSVADALSFNSAVFIKSYGPGAIATTAFRGGNAHQTAVLWNGFNLQNAMLGQADLSLMPAMLFENVEIEYGGSSSSWGSGAVAGSIHLNNKTAFGKGLFTSTNLGGGSYGMLNGSMNVVLSEKRFVSSTKLYINGSDNNLHYRDTSNNEVTYKRSRSARYDFKGLMQELKFMLNPRQILSVNAWLTGNQRHLPPFDPKAESKAYQKDETVRLSANWSYIKTNFKSIVRGAFFNDLINYDDSLTQLYSKSKAQTVMAENENYLNWAKHHQLNFGVNFSSSSAKADNYTGTRTLSRMSVLVGNKFGWMDEKLTGYVSVRGEYFSVGTLPVTGNASLEYKLLKNFSALVNVAKVYRQPTLNELYWVPGGNINLKPEQGYTYEGTLNYKKQLKNISVFISGAAYSRKIDNWIAWIPGANGNPSPVNIQQVWSRGTETTWKLNYRRNKLRAGMGVVTGYVLSTVESSVQEHNNTVGKQLIYTPRYTVNSNVLIGYDKIDAVFFHQYIGYRFTSSDNLRWLAPYQVSSLRVNYHPEIKKLKIILYAACNNLFNNYYTILEGRPMPLRNYEIGITLQTRNNNN
jgi:vitamin B12 transporter